MRLRDKAVIITGAGSGIGAASARLFGKEGAFVLAVDWNADGARASAEAIQATGGRATALMADVSHQDDWQRILKTALDAFGRVDVLFNNAGIGLSGNVVETTPEQWDRVHGINLRGVYLGCHTVIPHMLERRGGTIVNTASELGVVGSHGIAAYSAAKFGVIGLTKCIAIDFAKRGIRANALCPGPVDTPLIRRDEEVSSSRPEGSNDTPMGRWGHPEEIANAAVFLASDESSFMTGAALLVDGGVTAL